jgi:predicted Zn-dependent peptidase
MSELLEYTFDNGLKLIYQKRLSSSISAINVFCDVGSNYEPKPLGGVSHFIEHMVFKGTPTLPTAKDISEIFDSVGAYINAYTDKNATCYITKCESSYFERCLLTISDILMNSTFKRDEFEKEKFVVIEEINKSKDNTSSYLSDKYYELVFKGTSLARPIGGEEDIILQYKHEDVLDYYKHFYTPENMVVSVCTNIPYPIVINFIKKSHFLSNRQSTYLYHNKMEYIVDSTLQLQNKIEINVIDRELEQTHIAIGFRTTNMYDNDRYVLDMIEYILSGNMSSRLFTNLREKNGLTYNIDVDNSNYEFSGTFAILTSVDKSKVIHNGNKKGAIPIIIDTLNDLIENGISEDELNKIRGFIKGSLTLEYEDSLNVSDYNGRMILFDYPIIIPLNKLYDVYKSITIEDINSAIRSYFTKSRMNVFIIGQNINKKDIYTECDKLTFI